MQYVNDFVRNAGKGIKAVGKAAWNYKTVPVAAGAGWLAALGIDAGTDGSFAYATSMIPATAAAFEAARQTEGPWYKKLVVAALPVLAYKGWENANHLELYRQIAESAGMDGLTKNFASQGRYFPDILSDTAIGTGLSYAARPAIGAAKKFRNRKKTAENSGETPLE